MQLGLVIYGSLGTMTGGYLYDRKLVEHLRQHGDTVQVFSLPPRGYARNLVDQRSRDWIRRLSAAALDMLLEDELAHPSLLRVNRHIRRQVGTPILSIVHHLRSSEPYPRVPRSLYRNVERQYLRGVDGWICNSRVTLAAVQDVAGADRPALVAPPAGDRLGPGLAANAIAARARRSGPVRIAYVGSLTPRKGLHILLAALARVPPESWTLTVIGSDQWDTVYASRIRRQIVDACWTGRVELLGDINDSELAARLAASDLLAVPSTYEGFGIAYLEGMAFGLPALASSAGGAREVVRPGETGILIDPGDIPGLARAISTLASDREVLERMSLAARRHFETQPGWAASTHQIRAFLTHPAFRAPEAQNRTIGLSRGSSSFMRTVRSMRGMLIAPG